MSKTGLVILFVSVMALWPGCVHGGQAGNFTADTLLIDGRDEYTIHDYMSYYADTTILPIASVIKIAGKGYFASMRGNQLNVGFTDKYYWTKVSMRNPTAKPAKLMWVFLNPAINIVELFRVEGDSAVSYGKSGDNFPFDQRPVYFNLVTYPIMLLPGERSDFYAFMDKRNENLKIGFRLVDENLFNRMDFVQYLVAGILTGILLLIMLFNVFLFLSLKDEVHAWYSVYVAVAILLMLAFDELDFQFLYPGIPALSDISRLTTCGLNLFFMVFVMRKFYSLSHLNSRFYTAVMFLQWFSLVFTLCNIIVYKVFPSYELKKIYMSVFCVMAVLCMLIVVITSVEKVRQGFKPAYFYLFALSFLFIGGIQYIIHVFGWTNDRTTGFNGIQAGVVAETVVISFGLLYRYNLFKREKEKLVVELESNKIQATLQLIATQEAERKRIAEDLHDELSGGIASIRMNIQNLPVNTLQLQPIIKMLDKASEDVRNISHNLMPPDFADTGLKALLVNQYNQLNNEGDILFHFHISGDDKHFDKTDELMIYRIVNELTNNILKHSGATEATIQLIYYENYLEIMAEDNGKGIPQEISDGIGLKNIRSRVAYLGGKVNIHGNKFGTTIIVIIDYRK